MTVDGLVALTAAGCSVLLDVTEGRLPAVAHWGAPLGDLSEPQARNLVAAQQRVVAPTQVDRPMRLAVLPEHHTGYVGRPGLSGSRSGRSWSTRFAVREASLDGTPIGSYTSAGRGRLAVAARDDEAELDLALVLELLPSGLLRCRAAVTNLGAEEFQVDDLVLALPVPAEANELLDFTGRWGKERVPVRSPFETGTRLREGRRGRTGADAAFVLHAGTAGFGFGTGQVWGAHVAWSGNQTLFAERTVDGTRVVGGGALLLSDEVRLGQGESYSSPWLYGSYGTGLDESARRFHRYLRARPEHVSTERPVTLNVWEAVYFDHDLDTLLRLADRANEVGVERYVLDDGWFGTRRDDTRGLGDWYVAEDVWPNGLHPLVDHVTKDLGMQFGLWFEPEMVNPDSDVARSHPEWVMSARSEWPVEARHQQVLNLSVPECYDYVLGRLLALLDEYAISYVKWDHNRDLTEAGDQTRGGRPAVHGQICALYRMLDEIRGRHPGLEIESCSAGGGRIDLGILERTDRVWVSDCIDPLERQHLLRWTTQLLPPEMLGSHIASQRSHTTGRMHDLSFRAATAVFGHLGIEWNLLEIGERAAAELSAWVAFYKQHRALLLGGDLVRMDVPDESTFVHAVVAPDRSEAMVAYVLVGYPLDLPGPPIKIRGLDPARAYHLRPVLVATEPSGLEPPSWWGRPDVERPRVHGHPDIAVHEAASFPGSTFSGATLEHVGVAAPLLHPDHAVLLHARAVGGSPTALTAGTP
jgi:alpha-galactosidase